MTIKLAANEPMRFCPSEHHHCFDDFAEDWLSILRLNISGLRCVSTSGEPRRASPDHVSIGRFARRVLGLEKPLQLICEVVAPKKTLVREISCDLYQENNLLPARAVETFISRIEELGQTGSRRSARTERSRSAARFCSDEVRWGEDYEGPSDPDQLIAALRQAAMKRHRQHVANIHRNYGREIGLVSKRGTVKLRYAPTDALLKTLLFANVEKRAGTASIPRDGSTAATGSCSATSRRSKCCRRANLRRRRFRRIPATRTAARQPRRAQAAVRRLRVRRESLLREGK